MFVLPSWIRAILLFAYSLLILLAFLHLTILTSFFFHVHISSCFLSYFPFFSLHSFPQVVVPLIGSANALSGITTNLRISGTHMISGFALAEVEDPTSANRLN